MPDQEHGNWVMGSGNSKLRLPMSLLLLLLLLQHREQKKNLGGW
jgi:hypothetical protein